MATKSKIEWCDYSINPVKGLCSVACDYCYARRMYKRFKWDEEIRFEYADTLRAIHSIKRPSKILMGSTMELFGDWIQPSWKDKMFNEIPLMFPQHTLIFLTKQPQNLPREFPENCWVGVSATDDNKQIEALAWLSRINARVRFLSLEPLLSEIILPYSGLEKVINWVIIGQQTPVKEATTPKVEWVQEITEACDKAGVKVYLKNNLWNLLFFEGKPFWSEDNGRLRQEMPNG